MSFTYDIKIYIYIYISCKDVTWKVFFKHPRFARSVFKNLLFGGVDIPFADDNLEHDLCGVKERFQ